MGWECSALRREDTSIPVLVLVCKTKGQRSLGRPKKRCKNKNKTYLKETE
jgi:hypothetical protein